MPHDTSRERNTRAAQAKKSRKSLECHVVSANTKWAARLIHARPTVKVLFTSIYRLTFRSSSDSERSRESLGFHQYFSHFLGHSESSETCTCRFAMYEVQVQQVRRNVSIPSYLIVSLLIIKLTTYFRSWILLLGQKKTRLRTKMKVSRYLETGELLVSGPIGYWSIYLYLMQNQSR